jgi:hypothetical protein
MLKDSDLAAADLDHVRDAITGELIDWAKRMVTEAEKRGLYIEVTVSGSGLRFIGLSQGDELHRKFIFNRQTGRTLCRQEYSPSLPASFTVAAHRTPPIIRIFRYARQ